MFCKKCRKNRWWFRSRIIMCSLQRQHFHKVKVKRWYRYIAGLSYKRNRVKWLQAGMFWNFALSERLALWSNFWAEKSCNISVTLYLSLSPFVRPKFFLSVEYKEQVGNSNAFAPTKRTVLLFSLLSEARKPLRARNFKDVKPQAVSGQASFCDFWCSNTCAGHVQRFVAFQLWEGLQRTGLRIDAKVLFVPLNM